MKLIYESAVRDESGLLLFKSRFKAVGRRKGLREVTLERMELVCNEIVTNQLKHARGSGMIQLWLYEGSDPALDFFALDYGPGIDDLELARQDGTTTTGTMGRGLGAIERLSDKSAIYTAAKNSLSKDLWHGTAIWSRFYVEKPEAPSRIEYGIYLRALYDSTYNGDSIQVRNSVSTIRWLHMDGLGHGMEAAQAIRPAHNILDDIEDDLGKGMETLTRRLSGDRGAVGIMGEIDTSKHLVTLAGVGDMGAYIVSNGERRQVALSAGILGHSHRSIEVNELPFPKQAVLITASDGIRGSWTIRTLPQLWRLHPQMIALVMGQILSRSNDDRSILVIRIASQQN